MTWVGTDAVDRWIGASARNLADWHDASLAPLGVGTSRSDGLWSRRPMPPSIYLGAITLQPVAAAPGMISEIAVWVELDPDANFNLWDSFHELDLTGLGFVRQPWTGEWWLKEAAIQPEGWPVPGLEVERVSDAEALSEFGAATLDGFETTGPVREAGPFGMHHPATLRDPRMHYYVGRADGRVVTSSIAYVGDDVVGVYGLSTLLGERRRGYGRAILRAAALPAPRLDVVVQPDEMARRIATQIGFHKIGEFAPWRREG